MAKILVVEDDKDLNRFLSICLTNGGHEITPCYNGKEALDKLELNRYDMILTDIMMPIIDGFELAESVRLTDKTIPIIFMTAKDDKQSKIIGYGIGVDDYVVKPFDIDVLTMKINAVLRRAKIQTEKVITIGNFSMNADERVATVDGEEISLTVREFDILFKLLSFPKNVYSFSANGRVLGLRLVCNVAHGRRVYGKITRKNDEMYGF